MILVELDALIDPTTSAEIHPARRWSDGGYMTLASDTPAYQYWDSRLIARPSWRRGGQAEWMDGGSQPGSVGTFELQNADAALEVLWAERLRGRRVRVWYIEKNAPLGTRILLHTLYADRIEAPDEHKLTLYVLGLASKMDVRVTDGVYAGTGTAYDGQPYPFCLGTCLNVPAQLFDLAGLLYRVHDDEIHSVEQVYFNGDPIPSTDWTQTLSGFELLVAPIGKVTADILGDVDGKGGWIHTFKLMILRLAGIAGISASVDTTSLDAIDASLPGTQDFGYWTERALSVREVITEMCASVGAWWYERTDGMLAFARLARPSTLSSALVVTNANLDKKLWRAANDRAPNFSPIVLAQRNWYVHNDNELATWLALPTLKLKFRLTLSPTTDNTGSALAKPARLPVNGQVGLPTLIVDPALAQAEANRRGTLYPGELPLLMTFYVLLKSMGSLALAESGGLVLLTMPRMGMQAGAEGQILWVASTEKDDVIEITARFER
jgi:hypothetical protein